MLKLFKKPSVKFKVNSFIIRFILLYGCVMKAGGIETIKGST